MSDNIMPDVDKRNPKQIYASFTTLSERRGFFTTRRTKQTRTKYIREDLANLKTESVPIAKGRENDDGRNI